MKRVLGACVLATTVRILTFISFTLGVLSIELSAQDTVEDVTVGGDAAVETLVANQEDTTNSLKTVPPSKMNLSAVEVGNAGQHGVLYERWVGAPGNRVSKGTKTALHGQDRSMRGISKTLSVPEKDGDSYVSRFRGFVIAPTTAKVRFVVSSDDNSEVWLSSGSDPMLRRRVAWVMGDGDLGATAPGETGRFSSQWSDSISFVQGKQYYLEVWHKQAGGNGHLSLGWEFDGDRKVMSIPEHVLRPWHQIPSDSNDDGLPDEWQKRHGIYGQAEGGSWDDPDKDGISNFDEFVAGTDPLNAGPVPGRILWESWYGIYGDKVADFVKTPRFAGEPDRAILIDAGSTPAEKAGNYGSRISGLITPKETAEYELAVSGDEAVELWFSETNSPIGKERVAFGTQPRPKGDWFVPPCQRSRAMRLDAGKSYYFEIIQKNARGTGWAGIGWKKSDQKSFSEISSEFLSSPGIAVDDKNHDFLPDKWVDDTIATMDEKIRNRVVFTQEGDSDHDGLPNWLEAKLGTDPLSKSQVQETLIREWWFNVPGNSIDISRGDGVFLRTPSMLTLSHGARSESYTTDYFVSRYRGYITAPATGKYRFWISGDDQVELWLSETDRKFEKSLIAWAKPEDWQDPRHTAFTGYEKWDVRPGQKSKVIELKGGKAYFVEILHKDGGGDDHTEIAWNRLEEGSKNWTQRGLIDPTALLSYEGDANDLDDDYLPDSWEREYKLDAKDNGLKDRKKQGELGDFDVDGLTNREEYLLGTNPGKADSDGDGVSDADEVRIYGSDPTRRDASPPVRVADLPLGNVHAKPGNWMPTPDGGLLSISKRGIARFEFDLDKPGIYMVVVCAKAVSSNAFVPPVPIATSIDDVEIGQGSVEGGGNEYRWLTPMLKAGTHVVGVDNRNFQLGVALEITSLSLYKLDGEDSNGDALPDWIEGMLHKLSAVDQLAESSAVSPACIEGSWRTPGSAGVTISDKGVLVSAGLHGHWYANVPLNSTGDTKVKIALENGAFNEEHQISWTSTNLFSSPERILLRPGDSLKLVADLTADSSLGDRSSIKLDGAEISEIEKDGSRIASFAKPGRHELQAVAVSGGQSFEAKVTVDVLSGDFGNAFSVSAGTPRVWKLPGMDRELSLESDADLSLEEIPRRPEQARRLIATYPSGRAGSPRVVARIEPGGPIVAATTVNAFWIVSAIDTHDARVVETLPDGTRVVEFSITINGTIPSDLFILIDMFVPDAVFADGSTSYRLTAADFDEYGVARLMVYKAPGEGVAKICHRILAFENDEVSEDDEPSPEN